MIRLEQIAFGVLAFCVGAVFALLWWFSKEE